MILIYTAYLLLSAVVVFLVYYSSLGRTFKASALTLAVLLGVFAQSHYIKQLGSPIHEYPADGFVYVHHTAEGDFIKLWVWLEDRGDRLYIIPYTQETVKALEEAKEETAIGNPQSGEFEGEGERQEPGLQLDDYQGGSVIERKTNV